MVAFLLRTVWLWFRHKQRVVRVQEKDHVLTSDLFFAINTAANCLNVSLKM